TVPTKISVRNCFQRQELKASQESILLGNLHALAKDFDRYQTLKRIEQIGVDRWRLNRLAGLLAHARKYTQNQNRVYDALYKAAIVGADLSVRPVGAHIDLRQGGHIGPPLQWQRIFIGDDKHEQTPGFYLWLVKAR